MTRLKGFTAVTIAAAALAVLGGCESEQETDDTYYDGSRYDSSRDTSRTPGTSSNQRMGGRTDMSDRDTSTGSDRGTPRSNSSTSGPDATGHPGDDPSSMPAPRGER